MAKEVFEEELGIPFVLAKAVTLGSNKTLVKAFRLLTRLGVWAGTTV